MESLPEEIQDCIRRIVVEDRHVTARLLLRAIERHLANDVLLEDAVCVVKVLHARDLWTAMRSLNCLDVTIRRTCRRHHDIWLQLLEDPYDMRAERQSLLAVFYEELQPVLWQCAC